MSQDPEAGLRLRKGGTVTLSVSSLTVALPAIVGKTRAEATGILAGRHIIGDYIEEDAPDQPPGVVLRTDPAAGSPIPKSLPFVRVILSRAPQVAIPDVANTDPVAASAALGAGRPQSCARFQAGVERHHCSRQRRRHRPAAGTLVPPDSEVTLLISTGPALVDVPDVRGRTRSEAEGILTGAGFNVRVSFRNVPPPQEGTVLDQSPQGVRPSPRSFVSITVGI